MLETEDSLAHLRETMASEKLEGTGCGGPLSLVSSFRDSEISATICFGGVVVVARDEACSVVTRSLDVAKPSVVDVTFVGEDTRMVAVRVHVGEETAMGKETKTVNVANPIAVTANVASPIVATGILNANPAGGTAIFALVAPLLAFDTRARVVAS